MKKTTRNTNDAHGQARLRIGARISSCLVGLFAFVLCFTVAMPDSKQLDEANTYQTAGETFEQTSTDETQDADDDSPYVTGSSGATYERGKVLISVGPNTSAASVNAILAEYEPAITKDVSDQDLSLGFVEVQIQPDADIEAAVLDLRSAGVQAQPNFIYTIAEDEPEEALLDDATSDDIVALATQSDPFSNLSTEDTLGTQSSTASEEVTVNDPRAREQWMLDSVDAYKAWGIQKTAGSVSVAIMDTGCRVSHEDLTNNIRATYNSSSEVEGRDEVLDYNGHGTHVAGIIAAQADNGVGVAGVSYNAGLVIIKATKPQSDTDFDTTTLRTGYVWLLSDADGNGKTVAQEQNVRVVNLSVGGLWRVLLSKDPNTYGSPQEYPEKISTEDSLLFKSIDQAKDAGILTVSAAGNSNSGTPPYDVIPGDYENCFSVINLTKVSGQVPNDSGEKYFVARSSSSNYSKPGTTPEERFSKDICAPGTSILSTVGSSDSASDSAYDTRNGTSQATPCVAGIAALVYANKPTLSAQDVQDLLQATATDITTQGDDGIEDVGWDIYTGYGEVDAYHALQVTSASIPDTEVGNGETKRLALVAKDGSTIDNGDWAWYSNDESIAQVNPSTGEVKGLKGGSTTITATYRKSGSITATGTITVSPLDLSNATIDAVGPFVYTGSEIKPTLTVRHRGDVLEEGVDYTVVFTSNVNAGTAFVTVTGCGNYANSVSTAFKIGYASISDVKVEAIPSQVYTRNDITPEPKITYNGRTLVKGTDYLLTYSNNKNKGTATITISGKNNFSGIKQESFTITTASLSNAIVTMPRTSYEYTGSPITPVLQVTVNHANLTPGTDFICTYSNNVNVGTATVVVTGCNNYAGTLQRTFTIEKKQTSQGSSSSSSSNPSSSSSNSGGSSSTTPSNPTAPSASTVPPINTQVTGTWILSGSRWWFKYDSATQRATGKQYPFNEFVNIRGVHYHFDAGGWMHTGWVNANGTWYLFASSGAMLTDWHYVGGTWYYMDATGKMLTGWQWVRGVKYYLDSSGAMLTGWQMINGVWYLFDSSGAMLTGWQRVRGTWYYMDSNGKMLTGWQNVGGIWYYLNSSGAMLTGWQMLGGSWFYFAPSGAMLSNTWVGNYWLATDGAMAVNSWVNNNKYYVGPNGAWVPSARH